MRASKPTQTSVTGFEVRGGCGTCISINGTAISVTRSMRLLDARSVNLQEFFSEALGYAILSLSHTWVDGEEVGP